MCTVALVQLYAAPFLPATYSTHATFIASASLLPASNTDTGKATGSAYATGTLLYSNTVRDGVKATARAYATGYTVYSYRIDTLRTRVTRVSDSVKPPCGMYATDSSAHRQGLI